MGIRGPVRTPAAILTARGSWRAKSRPADQKPAKADPAAECPAWLKGKARAEWDRHVADLDKSDLAVLAAFCEADAEFISLSKNVARNPAKAIASGLMKAKNSAAERALKIAAQFGFSPVARTRLQTFLGRPPEASYKTRFFSAN